MVVCEVQTEAGADFGLGAVGAGEPEAGAVQAVCVAGREGLAGVEALDEFFGVEGEAVGPGGGEGVEGVGEGGPEVVAFFGEAEVGGEGVSGVGDTGDAVVGFGPISGDGVVFGGELDGLATAEEVVVQGDEAVAEFVGFTGEGGGEGAGVEVLDVDGEVGVGGLDFGGDVDVAQEEEGAEVAFGFGEEGGVEGVAGGEEEFAGDGFGAGAGVAVDGDGADGGWRGGMGWCEDEEEEDYCPRL